MFNIEGKLYQTVYHSMLVGFVYAISFLLALPLFTLPIVVIIYCWLMSNVVMEHKLFSFRQPTPAKLLYFIGVVFVGFCIMFSILSLSTMPNFFVSRIMMSFSSAFYVSAVIMTLAWEPENNIQGFIKIMRWAFFYTAAMFHKSVVPIFLFIVAMSWTNGLLPFYTFILGSCAGSYFLFRLHWQTIKNYNKHWA